MSRMGRPPYHCVAPMTGVAPRVGLTTYRESAAWGVWSDAADLLPATYSAGIRQAGAVAMLLPSGEVATIDVAREAVHGLVLVGGADVDPDRYGAQRDAATGPSRPERDEWELALARAAVARDLPVLAVCRGMQVLNVALGGSLRQHLPHDVGSDLHCPSLGVHGRHAVAFAAGSALSGLLGSRTQVATYHHQALDRLGAGLAATGWADDGVVEAVEMIGRTWILGVQWHPEAYAGAPLFEGFVAACTAYRSTGVC